MQGCVKLILLSGLLQGCLTGGELLLAAAAQHQLFSARFSNGGDPKILVEAGKTDDAAAYGYYSPPEASKSNFGHLVIRTTPSFQDEEQMRAAGFLEGWLTAGSIYDHFTNMWAVFNLTGGSDPTIQFQMEQRAWVTERANSDDTQTSPFWSATCLILAQFDGMLAGYNARAAQTRLTTSQAAEEQAHAVGRQLKAGFSAGRLGIHQERTSRINTAGQSGSVRALPPLEAWQLYFLCSLGDTADITAAVNLKHQHHHQQQDAPGAQTQSGTRPGSSHPKSRLSGSTSSSKPWQGMGVDWESLSPHEMAVQLGVSGRCTALVKVLGDFSDIFVSQVAWYSYAAMLRVYKHYDFALHDPSMVGRSLGFSSYFGQLSSDDDFYLVAPTKLVVLQTTNHIMDSSLYSKVQPQSVLSWQRVRAAHMVAQDGQQWAQAVGTHNSGTYTNSWVVVDLKLFQPRQQLVPDTLTVVEQVPGAMFSEDRTSALEAGYFALYNVPALDDAYTALGYPAFVAAQAARGPAYAEAVSGASRQMAPRAKIFRRDQGSVIDLESMRRLMRSNQWAVDPYSGNVSTNAICGRGDVDPVSPRLAGCYDGKVADRAMALALEADVVNGPPSSDEPWLAPFTWADEKLAATMPHNGQAHAFQFTWDRMSLDL